MGMLGRAAAGFGAGVAGLAQRYMNEEDAANRAKLLADLQIQTADTIRRGDAKFRDERAPLEREQRAADAVALASTQDKIELGRLDPNNPLVGAREGAKDREAAADTRRAIAGKKAELEELTPAQIAAQVLKDRAKGKTDTEIAAERGNNPAYLAALKNEAQAKHVDGADAPLRAEMLRMQIAELKDNAKVPQAVKTAVAGLQSESKQISDAITKVQAEGGQWDPTNNKTQGDLLMRQRANNAKIMNLLSPYMPEGGGSGATGADPLGIMNGGGSDQKRAAIAADMAKTGVKDALIDIGGKKSATGGAQWGAPAKEPGMLDRAATAVGGAFKNMREEGAVIEALRAKINAKQPLTPEEKALARRYGMTA